MCFGLRLNEPPIFTDERLQSNKFRVFCNKHTIRQQGYRSPLSTVGVLLMGRGGAGT